ncbi:ImmA/IrrE family metallo-endopeptidase [Candidatus Saccharibacteria bacterium]|jgi:Zn-dependent peptidase ImmA (M78 family)|nr:ImmA/IrrE family metallo-endopeptidase [Candidatus Saccharibacteria bacterium]
MYEQLLKEAEEEGLKVISWPFHGKTKGLYYDGVIAINKDLSTTAERTCILAEELGHYYTSCGNIIDTSDTNNRKQEVKARRWAVKRLVTLKRIIQAFEAGCRNMYELAEYIGVTEDFLRSAFATYNAMYGNFKKRGSYVIYFDPPGVYKNI